MKSMPSKLQMAEMNLLKLILVKKKLGNYRNFKGNMKETKLKKENRKSS
jgi:hypothetical protein